MVFLVVIGIYVWSLARAAYSNECTRWREGRVLATSGLVMLLRTDLAAGCEKRDRRQHMYIGNLGA